MHIIPSEIPGKAKLQPVFGARTQELHCFETSVIQQLQLDAQLWAIDFKDQAGAARRMVQLAKQFSLACKLCRFNHSFLQRFL